MPIEMRNRFQPLINTRGPNLFESFDKNKKRKFDICEDNNEERYLIIKKIDSENSFKTVSPFIIQKGLTNITNYIKSTQRLRNGDLLVLTNKTEGKKSLLKTNKMYDMPILVEEHKYLNSSKGVIFSYDLMYVDINEIEKELKEQKVTRVERIKRKINGELKDTPLHILTFDTTILPKEINAGFLKLDVRLYIPSPMRCHNCQRYEHTKTRCFRTPTCPKCAKSVTNGHENEDCSILKCTNCNLEHPSFDKKCPTFKMEQEIIKIKTMDRITYFKAKEIYIRENANTTGASNRNEKKTFSEVLQNKLETNKKETNNNNKSENNNPSSSNIINNNNNRNNNNNNQNEIIFNTIKENKKNNDSKTTTTTTTKTIENKIEATNKIAESKTPLKKSTKPEDVITSDKKQEIRNNKNLNKRFLYLNPAELNIVLDQMDEDE